MIGFESKECLAPAVFAVSLGDLQGEVLRQARLQDTAQRVLVEAHTNRAARGRGGRVARRCRGASASSSSAPRFGGRRVGLHAALDLFRDANGASQSYVS